MSEQSKRDFYQISLKVILKNRRDEVLILGGLPTGSFAGYFDLPGGRVNADEFTTPFEQIIARELKEEVGDITFDLNKFPVATGRHLIPASMTSEKKDLHILYLFFEARLLSGKIVKSDEHVSVKWVDLGAQDPKKLFKSGILEGIEEYLARLAFDGRNV